MKEQVTEYGVHVDYHPVSAGATASTMTTTTTIRIMRHRTKIGHSCCGGCCDMRRAVIAVNAIQLVGRAFSLIAMHHVAKIVQDYSQGYLDALRQGDDLISQIVSQGLPPADMTEFFIVLTIIILICGILSSILSIIGALRYNLYLVAANVIWLLLSTIATGLLFDDQLPWAWWLGILVNASFIYPHVYLIYYIHTGIMSEQNYVDEEQSCCCV